MAGALGLMRADGPSTLLRCRSHCHRNLRQEEHEQESACRIAVRPCVSHKEDLFIVSSFLTSSVPDFHLSCLHDTSPQREVKGLIHVYSHAHRRL